MEYNDFSLPQSWEGLAKAYSQSLKDKGFVFIRLNENQARKNHLATQIFRALKNLENLYLLATKRMSKNQEIAALLAQSKETAKQIENFYKVDKTEQKPKQNINFLVEIFKQEVALIKALVELLDEEDNNQIRQFLKTATSSRLETLEKAF